MVDNNYRRHQLRKSSEEWNLDPRYENWDIDHNRFEIIGQKGRGANGTVLEVLDHSVNPPYHIAIKRITNIFQSPQQAQRLYREIRILRLLRHPCILKLVEILPPSDPDTFNDLYLVTPYYEHDLFGLFTKTLKDQQLQPRMIQWMMYQLLCGVRYIQSAHILHRDIKTANILTDRKGNLVVADFGLARTLAEETTKPNVITDNNNPVSIARVAIIGAAALPTNPADVSLPPTVGNTITSFASTVTEPTLSSSYTSKNDDDDDGTMGMEIEGINDEESSTFTSPVSISNLDNSTPPLAPIPPTPSNTGSSTTNEFSSLSSSSSSVPSDAIDTSTDSLLSNSNASTKVSKREFSNINPLVKSPLTEENLNVYERALVYANDHKNTREYSNYVVTRWYRAPELSLDNDGKYTIAIDTWAIGCVFGECLNMLEIGKKHTALFPGTRCIRYSPNPRDYFRGGERIDQLQVILNVMGWPSQDQIACLHSNTAIEYLNTQYHRNNSLPYGSELPNLYPSSKPSTIELLKGLLTFLPEERISLDTAVKHPYFDEVRNPEHYETVYKGEPIHIPLLSSENMRTLILEEIQYYIHGINFQ